MKRQTDFDFGEENAPLSPPKTAGALQLPAAPPTGDQKLMTQVLHEEPAPPVLIEPKMETDPKKTMEKFEPDTYHYNYFYLGVSGHIESGDFTFLDGLSCKFSLAYGKDWQLADVFF